MGVLQTINCHLKGLTGKLFKKTLKRKEIIIIFFTLNICFQYLGAQTASSDSLGIIEVIVAEKDTMVSYSNQTGFQKRLVEMQEKSIDSVLFPQQGTTRFRKELYGLLFKNATSTLNNRKTHVLQPILADVEGKIIRSIEYRYVNIFAKSVIDTSDLPIFWLEKTINNLHINTRRKILSRYLLFNVGEPFDVLLASENERILRNLPFIMDARFLVKYNGSDPDSIDLILFTQDYFPIGFQALIASASKGSLSIWHNNILGYGHQLTATSYWDTENKPLLGYGFSYGIANIAGTFASGKIEYINKWNLNSYILNISRDFKSVRFKYAGGGLIENTSMLTNFDLMDTVLSNVDLRYTRADFWAGRMVRFNSNNARMSSAAFLTARVSINESQTKPVNAINTLYQYQDKAQILFSTGFSHQGFKTDNLIYTFGRTEDVPYGYLFEITSGPEWGINSTRIYVSTSASYGRYFRNNDYFYGRVKIGTFIHQHSSEQGAFQLYLHYFTGIHMLAKMQYRGFATLTYVNGINRFSGEYTSLENGGGIEGLKSRSIRGNDKLVLNLESVIFSPFSFLGFRFAFFGSVDLGAVSFENSFITDSKLFSGLNAGVRIRNDQLVFDTFVIRFSFYPGMPADAEGNYFDIGSMTRSKFSDFFPYKPEIIKYQ